MGCDCVNFSSQKDELILSKLIGSYAINEYEKNSKNPSRMDILKKSKLEMGKDVNLSIDNFKEYIGEKILQEESKRGELIIPNEIIDLLNKNLEFKSPKFIDKNTIYYGQWDNNIISGKGELYNLHLNKYIKGIWQNDNLYYGRIYLNEGIYEGYINENEFNGKGKMEYKNNIIYEGNWFKRLKEGKGTLIYPDGCKYIGNFKKEKKSGEGEFFWDNEDKYEGNFNNDIFEGEGYLKIKNGSEYKGNFHNGYIHGKGQFIWKNGDKYEGDYYYGKKKGKGIYIFNNGNKFNGEWEDNKPNNRGNFEFNNFIYKTYWNCGKIIEYSIINKNDDNNNNENINFNSLNWMIEDIDIKQLKHLNIQIMNDNNSNIEYYQNENTNSN